MSCYDGQPLMFQTINAMTIGSECLEYTIRALAPDIPPVVLVPGGDPGADGGHELFHRTMGAARKPLGGEFCEPGLDQVEP